ncbi:MAG: ABC transporter permease [Alphaproteobacteria bacterium]|nr:ABC transporter permease [Alphaproteobacteria bacterium]
MRSSLPPATWAGFLRGFMQAQPLSIGVFVYGIAFGLLARQENLSLLESLAMSFVVYSGSAQLAAVSAMGQGGFVHLDAITSIAAAIILLNARYLLYGAALWPWMGGAPARITLPSLFYLGDGNWILSMRAHAHGERDVLYVLGSGVAAFLPWLLGTWAGSLAGGLLADPKALGVDFLLVGFCAAMGIAMMKARTDWTSAACALAAALAVDRFAPGGWTIVAAGLVGGIVTFARFRAS